MDEILKTVLSLDKKLFYLINLGTQNPLFDRLMPFITDFNNWWVPIIIAWLALIIWGGSSGRVVAVLIIVTVALSDQASSHFLKPMIKRIRPCNALSNVHLLVNCTQSYSFPSSHAANIFAAATLFSNKYRRFMPYFLIFAFMIAYSRIYVGVHYPLDALSGVFVGIACAAVVLSLELVAKKAWQKYQGKRNLRMTGM